MAKIRPLQARSRSPSLGASSQQRAAADTLYQQAIAYHRNGQLDQAESSYTRALEHDTRHLNALHMLGVIAGQRGDHQRALELLNKVIAIDPLLPAAFYHLGTVRENLQHYAEALRDYDRALTLKADYVQAYNKKANVLTALKQYDEALHCYDQAIRIRPDFAEAHNNRGLLRMELDQHEASLADFDAAIRLNPRNADLHYNKGNALQALKQFNKALTCYEAAISLRRDYVKAYCNHGTVLQELKQYEAALKSYDTSIAIDPDHAESYRNRGTILSILNQYPTALLNYRKAMELAPDLEGIIGEYLNAKMHLCDWDEFGDLISSLVGKIRHGHLAISPFTLFAYLDSPLLHLKNAVTIASKNYPANDSLGPINRAINASKIKVGYFSADFHEHPVSFLAAGLFEAHDRGKFEVIAISYVDAPNDPMRARLQKVFDQFIDVSQLSDTKVASLAREMGIDIAVDLGGCTKDSRPGVFALRAAPIQVNWLGFPGTLGVTYMDYILADEVTIPLASQRFYRESVVHLPHCYMPNDSKKAISERAFTRSSFGLPESTFVYCCFNGCYKITPIIFDIWMRILSATGDSVLWLMEGHPSAVTNLRQEAAKRGVAGDRLIFAKRLPLLADHLARYHLADLFLDTFPFNAHTTASDALWAGLPVLTCAGRSFASRVGASLLSVLQLPELITQTADDYQKLAIEFGNDPVMLIPFRSRLERNRLTTPLFDTTLFAANIENVYQEMAYNHNKKHAFT